LTSSCVALAWEHEPSRIPARHLPARRPAPAWLAQSRRVPALQGRGQVGFTPEGLGDPAHQGGVSEWRRDNDRGGSEPVSRPPTWPQHQHDDEDEDQDPRVWDLDAEAKGDSAPHIPPGDQYVARVVKVTVENVHKFDSRRLVLVMKIIDGAAAGTRLEFWTKFPRVAGPKSKFLRTWEVAHGAPAKRKDRLSLKVFRHRLFRVLVQDVTKDRYQRPLARPYSTITAILERTA
jgi:hypothetical protein